MTKQLLYTMLGPHDVLLGRGGGINGHVGNRVFREWVHERKEDYNLAGTKAEKIVLKKGYTAFKDHITLADYEIRDGMNLELYYQ